MEVYHLDLIKFICNLTDFCTLEKIRKLENSSNLQFCVETFR